MSTNSVSLPYRLAGARRRTRPRALATVRPELAALLALAAVLNLWALSRNGFANEYYSAAVRSMASSWHAFLYGSFDPAGVMTVDKPPLALWVQALSVRTFGFSSWSMLAPQALMGVATVGLTYDLVRRRFGRAAGFAGGLVLALTPVSVAIARHNNPDALLVLCVTGAVWALVRGLEDGRTRWVVVSGVCVGLGFEAKMAAALLVVPALAAAWLWVAPRGRIAAVRQLLAGGAAMVVVGGAWPLLMALTPASGRPWVSGTSDNSIWSLILGYNGLGRLFGQDGGPGGGAGGPGGPGGGGPGGLFGGEPGALRLLNEALGGQAGWLLGFALVAGAAVLVSSRLRRADARTGWLIAAGGSFLTIAVAFSQAQGIFHPYYVSELAPFTAALVGAGVGELLRGGRVARVAGPLAIAAGVAAELAILHDHPGELAWVAGVLVAAAWPARRPWPRGLRRGCAPRWSQRSWACCSWLRRAGRCRRSATRRAAPSRPVGRRPRRWASADRAVGRWAGRPGARARGRRLPSLRPPAPARQVRARQVRARQVRARRPARARPGAACSAATARRWPRRSPTSRPTAAARSPSPASPARPASSSRAARTSRRSAASPAAKARSASSGWPTPSRTGASAGCSRTAPAAGCPAMGGSAPARSWPPPRGSATR